MRTILILCAVLSVIASPDAIAQETPAKALPSELPLHTAITAGDLDEVRRLLRTGADPNAMISIGGSDHNTPLAAALHQWPGGTQEELEVVARLLLEAGADPNGVFNVFGAPGSEEVPLSVAASSPGLLRMLLNAGADPNVGFCFGQMQVVPMDIAELAEEAVQAESLALLRAAGAHPSSLDLAMSRDPAGASLHMAVSEYDVARVKHMLEAGSDPHAALVGMRFANGDVDRMTPLQLAFPQDDREFDSQSRTEVVRLLLAAGADANEPFRLMCGAGSPTALLMAVARGEEDVVKMLLNAGADPNVAAEAFGAPLLPPLTFAAAEGHTRVAQLLLDAGADPNAAAEADGARFNALDVALSGEHMEIADMLRARGARTSAPAAADTMDNELPRDFAAAFASCTAGEHLESALPQAGVEVRYEIVGPEVNGCRVSLTYVSNPNPEWERKPLMLTLDPQKRFMAEIETATRSCRSGEASRFDCGGPLLDVFREAA